jgi:osmoprotectant transport system substrate-binding protein
MTKVDFGLPGRAEQGWLMRTGGRPRANSGDHHQSFSIPPVGHAAGHRGRAGTRKAGSSQMRFPRRSAAAALGLVAIAAVLAGCGSSGSSGTKPVAKASGTGCAPIAGTQLVVLSDDKHLQSSDDIVPAYSKAAAQPPLVAALDKVSGVLNQTNLLAMNKAVDVDRQTPAAAAAAFASANGLTAGIGTGGSGKIVIAAADFSENQELAELYKIVLTEAGYSASTQIVDTRELYEPLLEQNKVQVVPEYAASLTTFLNTKQNGANSTSPASGDITTTMAALTPLATKANIVLGMPSTATDENAFAVTKATADKYGLTTLSSFAAKCSGKASSLAGPAECPTRPYCQLGLQQTYGITFGTFDNMGQDTGGPVTKKALTSGAATMGLVFSSDSTLTQ